MVDGKGNTAVADGDIDVRLEMRRAQLFKGVATDDLDRLGAGARVVHAKAGTLWEGGSPDEDTPLRESSLYIILEGCAEVLVDSGEDEQDREIIVAVLCADEFFGELRLLEEDAGSAFVRAVTDCKLLELSGEPLLKWLKGQPKVLMRMLHVLASRLRLSSRFTARKARDRVCALLVQLADRQTGEVELSRMLTQKDLAALVGVGRETFNRILGDLPAGVIETEVLSQDGHRRLIKVVDRERLRAFQ